MFFKGCNLNCKWCHNPESQNIKKEIMFYKNKCTLCGRCTGLTIDNENFLCFNDAKEVWIRIPVISGINDTEEEFYNIKSFLHKTVTL